MEERMTLARNGLLAAVLVGGAILASGCDRSPQAADGATDAGNFGTAAATRDGTIAATGGTERGAENATPTDKGVESGMSTSPSGAPATVPPEVAKNAH
jgi:hypothetical protein